MRKFLGSVITVTLLSGCSALEGNKSTDEVLRLISGLTICDDVDLYADNGFGWTDPIGNRFDTVHCNDDVSLDVYESSSSLRESMQARCDEWGVSHVNDELVVWGNVAIDAWSSKDSSLIIGLLGAGEGTKAATFCN